MFPYHIALLNSVDLGVMEYGSVGVMEKNPILQYANTPLIQLLSDNLLIFT